MLLSSCQDPPSLPPWTAHWKKWTEARFFFFCGRLWFVWQVWQGQTRKVGEAEISSSVWLSAPEAAEKTAFSFHVFQTDWLPPRLSLRRRPTRPRSESPRGEQQQRPVSLVLLVSLNSPSAIIIDRRCLVSILRTPLGASSSQGEQRHRKKHLQASNSYNKVLLFVFVSAEEL